MRICCIRCVAAWRLGGRAGEREGGRWTEGRKEPAVQIWERLGTGFALSAWPAEAWLVCPPACLSVCLPARPAPPRPEPSGVPRKQWEIDGGA